MAQFRYIGLITKSDGTVDVRVPKSDGTVDVFTGVVPNTTTIDVTDSRSIKGLEFAVDFFGMFIYERLS